MGCAICIVSNNASNEKIRDLWSQASLFENTPSMQALDYLPHFTFGIYPEMDAPDVALKFQNVFRYASPVPVVFDKIGFFDASPLVLWAAPQKNRQLEKIHEKVHSVLDQQNCHNDYRPSRWVPHCTLATEIDVEKRDDALEFASAGFKPFQVIFDSIDFVNFSPVDIVESRTLSNSN